MSVENSRSFGAYHIANSGIEYNPQRKNNFTLVVNGLDNLPRMGTVDASQGTPQYIVSGQEQISIGLKSCDTPQITQNPIEIDRMNSKIKFAGKPSFNTLNMTAYDYMGSDVKDTLLAWQNLSYNTRYDYVGNAWSYKKDCQLLQLTPDGDIVRYWDIKGAWLQSVTPGGFDYSSGDEAQTVDAVLVYDFAELKLPDTWTI